MTFDLIATTQGDWQVHKHGCRDVPKVQANSVTRGTEAESAAALVQRELDLADGELREMGYSEDDFRIMPCCKEATR